MANKDTKLPPKKRKVSENAGLDKKKAEKFFENVKSVQIGRKSSFTQEIADAICSRIADGQSLRTICADEGMPDKATVMRWLEKEDAQPFRDQYARARDAQADHYAEEIIDIADEEVTMVKRSKHNGGEDDDGLEQEVVFDPTAVARNRLRVDARKWYASKLAPKKYGDKVQTELTGLDGGPIMITKVERVVVDPAAK